MLLSVLEVQNHQDVAGDVVIGVSAHGLTVYKEAVNIHRWLWQAVIDFSYNRGGFSVKVRPKVSRVFFVVGYNSEHW